jgi:trans-aconitate methyltransferase
MTRQSVFNPSLISAAPMPSARAYDDEYTYWPWGDLLDRAAELIVQRAPQRAVVTDYMCATGMLLSKVTGKRPDIEAAGCDIHYPFVEFANASRPRLDIEHADARDYRFDKPHDVIACTAGLHHLPFDEHSRFLKALRGACRPDTLVIIGEEVLPPHDEGVMARVAAALELNLDLVNYARKNKSPEELVDAALMVLRNDVLLNGEYKRDIDGWHEVIGKQFDVQEVVPSWNSSSGGGDFLFICTPR